MNQQVAQVAERIRELEAEYEKRIRAERERPVQLNLFEML